MGPVQSWRSRSFVAALLGLAYVLFAALQTRPEVGAAWLALVVLPGALALAWARTAPPPFGVDPIEPAVRVAARLAATGASLVVAAWLGAPGAASLVAGANLGTALATVAALLALARIAPTVGLLPVPAATRRLDAVALAALFFGTAVALPAARALFPERTTLLDPLTIDYTTTAAATGAVGLVVAAAARVRALRGLELGVADRASAALALPVVVLALAAPAALLRVAAPDRVMTFAALLASGATIFSCISREPTGVARAMRTVLAVVGLGAPVALLGIGLAFRYPQSSGIVVLTVGAAAVIIGLAAPALGRPFAPAGSRWLEAIRRANEAALHPDPDVALREALFTVRSVLPGDADSPVLFRTSPVELLTIDRAGYLHVQPGDAPPSLYEVAAGEPDGTVRAQVLRALEVRRPDLRPLVSWMDAHRLLAVTLVRDEEGPVGILGLPRGRRRLALNLEEVRALRLLADRVGAVLGVSSALARSRAREMDLRRLADRRGDTIDALKHQMSAAGSKHRAAVERLARPATRAAYSPAATVALDQVQRLGQRSIPLTLLVAPGLDPVPWAAAAVLAGPRQDRPLVIVDATDGAEHELAHWRSAESSPLVLAMGGTLLALHVNALPGQVQDFLAASLAQRVSPGLSAEPLDVWLAVAVPATVDTLMVEGKLTESLADWLGDRAVPVPALAMRSEDMRALALDHLARLGARLRSEPLGLDDMALERMLEHGWPGNDVELADVLLRAALVAKGRRVTVRDLDAIGFSPRGRPGEVEPSDQMAPPVQASKRRVRRG